MGSSGYSGFSELFCDWMAPSGLGLRFRGRNKTQMLPFGAFGFGVAGVGLSERGRRVLA